MDDFNIDFENINFDLRFDIDFLNRYENRYINPKPHKEIPESRLYFEHALNLAKSIQLGINQRAHVILSGNFVMGDFIEALFIQKNIHTKNLSISTLSMSQNNIDSLKNLFIGNYIDSLDLIISDYFFAHERSELIPYMLKELDEDNKFTLAVAGSHTKICIFESVTGKKIVISGSSNLRSSGCLEQVTIEENKQLYDFYKDYHNRIINEYQIINKSIRAKRLWQAVAVEVAEAVRVKPQQQGREEEHQQRITQQLHLSKKYF